VNPQRLAGRLNLLGPWLRRRFGGPVMKIGLDAGLGCPNRDGTLGREGCSFCPPSGSGAGGEPGSIGEQLRQGLARLQGRAQARGRRVPAALAYFQAHTSTHAEPQRLEQLYSQALGVPGVAGVIVSTRPDCLDEPRWRLLDRLNRRTTFWLELGLQSACDQTLARLGRGHDVAAFDRALARARELNIRVVAHVILGLPGEGREHTAATARHLARSGVWGVKMHSLMVLEQTGLAREYQEGRFIPWSRETWARAAAEFLALLPRRVLIHRLVADPGRERLLAPEWAGDKNRALAALARVLEENDWEQGSLCPQRD